MFFYYIHYLYGQNSLMLQVGVDLNIKKESGLGLCIFASSLHADVFAKFTLCVCNAAALMKVNLTFTRIIHFIHRNRSWKRQNTSDKCHFYSILSIHPISYYICILRYIQYLHLYDTTLKAIFFDFEYFILP